MNWYRRAQAPVQLNGQEIAELVDWTLRRQNQLWAGLSRLQQGTPEYKEHWEEYQQRRQELAHLQALQVDNKRRTTTAPPQNVLPEKIESWESLFSGRPLNPFENVTVNDPRNPNQRVRLN